jgi:hypothetical protein
LEDLHVTHALTKNRIVKDANHAKLLYDWLVEDSSNGDFVLLYHASRDGNEAVTFHSNCDDMGATLTIIKTTDGHIIEGYSPCCWMNDLTYATANKAFLVAISKTDKFTAKKMKLTGSQDYSIYKNPLWGPTFR